MRRLFLLIIILILTIFWILLIFNENNVIKNIFGFVLKNNVSFDPKNIYWIINRLRSKKFWCVISFELRRTSKIYI